MVYNSVTQVVGKIKIMMDLTKGQALLYIYNKLESEKMIIKTDIMDQCGLTDITFKRYIAEIRAYVKQFEDYHEIKYVRKKDIYLLVKTGK